jgi:hypothetical protein
MSRRYQVPAHEREESVTKVRRYQVPAHERDESVTNG